jgi:hypothetical protein
MKNGRHRLVAALVAASTIGAAGVLSAQLEHMPMQLKYNQGQAVQPIFDGWSRNDDGSFSLHFGYLNRNYIEEPHVPVGPLNNIEPGGPDRGQPTYFYPRINRAKFKVRVPKDFGKREVVWTVTAHGETLKAVGWLQAEWEVNEFGAASRTVASQNTAPVLKIDAVSKVALPGSLTLNASLTDDGLPKPGSGAPRKQAVGQETPPILQPTAETVEAPINVPGLRVNPRGARINPRPPQGLSVTYSVWRGPGPVDLEPMFALAKDGRAQTVVRFRVPGEYVLRARAWDGALATEQDLKITVTGTATQ